jgi:tetratricopeptide (TPR) repeat protein
MFAKKPPIKPAKPLLATKKRSLSWLFGVLLLLVGVGIWWFWSSHQNKAPQLQYILFEKNEEQIKVKDNESLQADPQDRLKILEIVTNVFHNKGVRLTSSGFDVNALLNDKLVMGTLLPQNEIPDRYQFKIEVKYFNQDIGSIELQVEPMIEDWLGLAEKTIDKNTRIAILEKALQLHPDDKLVQNRIMEEFRSQHKWPQLAKLLEDLLKDQPSEKNLNELTTVYETLKKPDEAVAALRRLLKAYPQNTEARAHLAGLLEEQKKYPEAIAEYETLLKQVGPESQLPLYKTLGFLYTETGQTKEAITAFLKAVELDPKDVNLYYNLSSLYSKNGDTEQSDVYLTKALGLKIADNETRLKLAESLLKKQKYEEAEKYLKEILDKDPKSLKALLVMGQVLAAKKDKPGLKNIYLKILDLDPDNDTIIFNLGVLEYEQGDPVKAQNYFKTFLKKHPQDAEAHNLLFEIYKKQKQDEAALKEALTLADLRPADLTFYHYIFDLLSRQGHYTEMIPIMQKGVAKNPDKRELREYLTLAFLKTGQEDQAVEQLKELLKLRSKDINLWLQLAKLQEKQEKFRESLDSYQKILDIDPDNAEAEEAYLRLKLQMLQLNP